MADWQLASAQWRKQYRWIENPGVGVFSGLIIAIVALVVVIALWVAQRQSQLEVPALAGLSRVEAETLLKNVGLNLRATYDEPSDRPPGTVLRTDPAAGKELDQGAGVSLVVAIPRPAPTASGSAEPSPVQQSTPAQELAPVVVPRVEASDPVVMRSPVVARPPAVVAAPVAAPQPVVAPSPVSAPPPVMAPPPAPALRQVPQVVGLDGRRAARVLADEGLSVGWVVEQESGERAGTVLRTNPRAGTAVRPGSSVDLVIAKRRGVEVPEKEPARKDPNLKDQSAKDHARKDSAPKMTGPDARTAKSPSADTDPATS